MSDREEKKPRLEKMVDASEYKQKDTAINKLIKAFIPDNIYDLKDYIVSEIVIPTIKDGLDDTWNAVFRGSGRKKSSYRKYYDDRRRDDRYSDDRYYQPERSDFKNVKFKSRGDAERILTKMEDIIYKNRFVSLLDFYDLTGQPTRSTDDNYGWTNLDRAKVERLRSDNGYIIRFPSPMPLDREYD